MTITSPPLAAQLLGWGYEGRTVDDLVADAHRWAVDTVVDVRLNAISRRKGFSKRALAERLAAAGVQYVHLRELGNPRDNRAGFAEVDTLAGRRARETYRRDVLGTATARAGIERLASGGPAIILCFEAHEQCCHRSLVLDAVRRVRASEEPVGRT